MPSRANQSAAAGTRCFGTPPSPCIAVSAQPSRGHGLVKAQPNPNGDELDGGKPVGCKFVTATRRHGLKKRSTKLRNRYRHGLKQIGPLRLRLGGMWSMHPMSDWQVGNGLDSGHIAGMARSTRLTRTDRSLRLRDTPIWKLESGIPVQVMPRALQVGVTGDQAHERARDRTLRLRHFRNTSPKKPLVPPFFTMEPRFRV